MSLEAGALAGKLARQLVQHPREGAYLWQALPASTAVDMHKSCMMERTRPLAKLLDAYFWPVAIGASLAIALCHQVVTGKPPATFAVVAVPTFVAVIFVMHTLHHLFVEPLLHLEELLSPLSEDKEACHRALELLKHSAACRDYQQKLVSECREFLQIDLLLLGYLASAESQELKVREHTQLWDSLHLDAYRD